MTTIHKSGLSGRDYYAGHFRHALDWHEEWLRRGAAMKADSVVELLARRKIQPTTLLDLGSGTGAVIKELKRRDVADHYYAVDYSKEAIRFLAESSEGIQTTVADITTNPNPFDVPHIDVIVVSHVIEHLEQPDQFLRAIHNTPSTYLVVEVPLEDLFFGKVKALVKDRDTNPAGHVQFFTRTSFRALLQRHGYTILEERLYPVVFDKDMLRFAYGNNKMRHLHKALTEHYLPRLAGPLWKRLWHAHFAVLCTIDGSPSGAV